MDRGPIFVLSAYLFFLVITICCECLNRIQKTYDVLLLYGLEI